jgi:vesicle transport through interaction with t-SNAREs protein 1
MSDSDFVHFLSDFRSLNSSLSSRLQSVPRLSSLQEQQDLIAECRQTQAEIEALFQSIEPELRHFEYSAKQRAQQQLKECKIQFDSQNRLIQQYSASLAAGRVVGSSSSDSSSVSFSSDQRAQYKKQRELLLGNDSMLADSNASLDSTQRVLAETTAIGTDTTLTLQKQREQFLKQKEMLEETDSILGRSKATLRRMQKRLVTNKLMSVAIILAEMGVVALIVYLKYYH